MNAPALLSSFVDDSKYTNYALIRDGDSFSISGRLVAARYKRSKLCFFQSPEIMNEKNPLTKSKERFEAICGLQDMRSFLHLIRTTMKGAWLLHGCTIKMVGYVALDSFQGFRFPIFTGIASPNM